MTMTYPVNIPFQTSNGPRSNLYLLVHSYWRNAQKARDPEFAMNAQAMLWGLATSPNAPDRIKRAAFRHLEVIGEAPTEM